MALKDGSVAIGDVAFAWETVNPITRAFRRMVRTGEFDLCEIALTTLAQGRAFGKELTGLPVVVMRGFHHAALVCPVGSPLRGPKDLAGKRIGVRAFSQTTGVWLRGILLDDLRRRPPLDHLGDRGGCTCPGIPGPAECRAHPAGSGPEDDVVVWRNRCRDRSGRIWTRHRSARSFRMRMRRRRSGTGTSGAYPVNHVVCVKTELMRRSTRPGRRTDATVQRSKGGGARTERRGEVRADRWLGSAALRAGQPIGPASNCVCVTPRNKG